jgi:hypothetical protein
MLIELVDDLPKFSTLISLFISSKLVVLDIVSAKMLFAICHPSIPNEAQVGLALRILCGFGINEIANAFLTNNETINKRLSRAKEKLRLEKVKIEFPGKAEIDDRLETVLTTLYLLFSEGYYSESDDTILREDLCDEAMRLTFMLIENEQTNQPKVNALYSLMCFHASRFAARKNEKGEIVRAFHSGDMNEWRAFVAINLENKTGVVYFSNSRNGLILADKIISPTVDLEDGFKYIFEKYGFARKIEPDWQKKEVERVSKIIATYEQGGEKQDAEKLDAQTSTSPKPSALSTKLTLAPHK